MPIVANHTIKTASAVHRKGELIEYLDSAEEQRLVNLGAAFYVQQSSEDTLDDSLNSTSAEENDRHVFMAMKKAELKAYAERLGIAIDDRAKHDDMVDAIMNADTDIDLDALPMSALMVMAEADGLDVAEDVTEEELRDILAGA